MNEQIKNQQWKPDEDFFKRLSEDSRENLNARCYNDNNVHSDEQKHLLSDRSNAIPKKSLSFYLDEHVNQILETITASPELNDLLQKIDIQIKLSYNVTEGLEQNILNVSRNLSNPRESSQVDHQ